MSKTARTPHRDVAFIGLGVMGFPMATHLAKAGHRTTVYNRTAARAEAWVQSCGGHAEPSPGRAAQWADVVFTCVGNDDDLRSVVLGPGGALSGMAAGSILVDHTTASAEVAQELQKACAAQGVAFMDAPVSGGNVGAQQGTLTVMCGSDDLKAFARAEPVMRAYAKAVTLLGPCGSGQKAKMVNQIAIAGLLQGLAEALAFGQKAGLDMPKVLSAISQGAAQSWQMQHRGPTMLEGRFDFGFAVDWMRKDLGLVLDEAARCRADLPLTEMVQGFYAEVQAMGGGRWDTSSLIQRLARPGHGTPPQA
jgi:3-hydroxyisobutyrate dehydrogenase